jgi:uncharacterized protein
VTDEPGRRLASDARWLWRVEQLLFWGAVLVAGVVVGRQLDGALALLVQLGPIVALAVGAVLVPELRWRRWRWDVRPDAIDIRHGTLTIRRTLVPMLRVQHVDTTRDIVEQGLDLATVHVHTAAGSHKIPLLALADAGEVRDRIAGLAEIADEP